jgi:hypothetical protein
MINLNFVERGNHLILKRDIIITDSDNFPIKLKNATLDGGGHTISILGCRDWPGLFVMDNSKVENLRVSFKDCELKDGSAPVIASSREQSANGQIANCRFDISSENLVNGGIVGPEALNRGSFKISDCQIKIQTGTLKGGIFGPRGCCLPNRTELRIEKTKVHIRSKLCNGFLIGQDWGHSLDSENMERANLSIFLTNNTYTVYSEMEGDDFNMKFSGAIGTNFNEKIGVSIVF